MILSGGLTVTVVVLVGVQKCYKFVAFILGMDVCYCKNVS